MQKPAYRLWVEKVPVCPGPDLINNSGLQVNKDCSAYISILDNTSLYAIVFSLNFGSYSCLILCEIFQSRSLFVFSYAQIVRLC